MTVAQGRVASSPVRRLASEGTPLVRIVVANDRPIARDGLRWLLETQARLSVVGATGRGSEAVSLSRRRNADVLLVDFPLCGGPTLDTLRALTKRGGSVRPIILTESVETPDLAEALQLGARGILLNESPVESLFAGIDQVMTGRYWIISRDVLDPAAGARELETERRRRQAFGLTRRELEIIRAVLTGYRNKSIAETFSITENTVKSHLTNIFNKVGVSNRVELALFAAHHRVLEEPRHGMSPAATGIRALSPIGTQANTARPRV